MRTKKDGRFVGSRYVGGVLVAAWALPASAQVTVRVNLDSAGAEANAGASDPSISADGRYVAFQSTASDLVPGDTNASRDVFVRDRLLGTTERASVDSGDAQANGDSGEDGLAISADGRYVAFESSATNLVTGDTNAATDVFVRDRQSGTTERVSLSSAGTQGNGSCQSNTLTISISADGHYVTFSSLASNLVAADANARGDVFVRDRLLGTTERVSVDSAEVEADGFSTDSSVSDDGRYVAFTSVATNLVAGDANGISDIFVRDRQLGTTACVSVDPSGNVGNSFSNLPSISADGRYVAFQSDSTTLVAGDTNFRRDVFLRDRQSGTTERVSVASGGGQGNDDCYFPSMSSDARYVAFYGPPTNLVAGDTNGGWDVFLRDRQLATTVRVSLSSAGSQANGSSYLASISDDGRYVAFRSDAADLVQGDTNGFDDIFVHDRLGGPDFTSLCHPGVAGVSACPCSNPPSVVGRGCNNSSGTGGAMLSASGATYLSSDSLVFTTAGEKPTALSTVWQAPTLVPAGQIMGQGVRCGGGALKRLYNKSAVGGSITAPSFGAGDPTVSARSAALGVPIVAGQSKYYFVSYRDPTILGGCPPVSTFNVTQTGRVTWAP